MCGIPFYGAMPPVSSPPPSLDRGPIQGQIAGAPLGAPRALATRGRADIAVLPARSPGVLAGLEERRRSYAQATRAANTARVYASAWRRFHAWACVLGYPSLPASPTVVGQYLAYLGDAGLGIASVELALKSIAAAHREGDHAWDARHPDIAQVVRGLRRRLGTAPRKKAAINAELLALMVARLPPMGCGLMERAMLTTGWFGALRRAELVALERGDVQFVAEGMVLHVRVSKTDQERSGEDVAIHRQDDETICPVLTLQAWLAVSKIEAGLIFDRHPEYVALLVKRLCAELGLEPSRFGAHSLRSGLITTVAGRDEPLHKIMPHSRHKNERVAMGYIRPATLFSNNVTKGLFPKKDAG
jgi:integrase